MLPSPANPDIFTLREPGVGEDSVPGFTPTVSLSLRSRPSQDSLRHDTRTGCEDFYRGIFEPLDDVGDCRSRLELVDPRKADFSDASPSTYTQSPSAISIPLNDARKQFSLRSWMSVSRSSLLSLPARISSKQSTPEPHHWSATSLPSPVFRNAGRRERTTKRASKVFRVIGGLCHLPRRPKYEDTKAVDTIATGADGTYDTETDEYGGDKMEESPLPFRNRFARFRDSMTSNHGTRHGKGEASYLGLEDIACIEHQARVWSLRGNIVEARRLKRRARKYKQIYWARENRKRNFSLPLKPLGPRPGPANAEPLRGSCSARVQRSSAQKPSLELPALKKSHSVCWETRYKTGSSGSRSSKSVRLQPRLIPGPAFLAREKSNSHSPVFLPPAWLTAAEELHELIVRVTLGEPRDIFSLGKNWPVIRAKSRGWRSESCCSGMVPMNLPRVLDTDGYEMPSDMVRLVWELRLLF